MFLATLQFMMGSIGRFLSKLYSEYSLYINFIALVYGMGLLWVHHNLRTAIKMMEKGMVHIAQTDGSPYNPKKIHKTFSDIWKEKNKDKYILIPTMKDIWFERVNSSDLIKLLKIDSDYVKMALHKNLNEPERSKFSKYKYLAWEGYRHYLVRGIRKNFVEPREIKERMEKRNRK